jgi:hypothetical protein
MAIKFGLPQVGNPTPSKINLWVRVYTVIASTFLVWMITSPLIGPHTQNTISSLIGLSLALVNGLAPLFGVQVNDNQNVKASDVTAMEDTNIKKL